MGVFLTPEMDRRFTYPLMFGASRFAMYQIESRAQCPYRVKNAEFELLFGRMIHHSYRSE